MNHSLIKTPKHQITFFDGKHYHKTVFIIETIFHKTELHILHLMCENKNTGNSKIFLMTSSNKKLMIINSN